VRVGSLLTCGSSAVVVIDAGEIGDTHRRRTDPDDLDVAERFRLIELDESLLEQFEDGEEPHDDLESFDEGLRQSSEGDPPEARELVDQFLDGLADTHPDAVDVVHAHDRDRFGCHRSDVRGSHIVDVDALEKVWREFEVLLIEAGPPWDAQRRIVEEVGENVGRVLERLAIEEPCDEEIAFLPQGELVVEVDIGVLGQESLALSSTSVAAMRRNSVVISRSSRSIFSISAR